MVTCCEFSALDSPKRDLTKSRRHVMLNQVRSELSERRWLILSARKSHPTTSKKLSKNCKISINFQIYKSIPFIVPKYPHLHYIHTVSNIVGSEMPQYIPTSQGEALELYKHLYTHLESSRSLMNWTARLTTPLIQSVYTYISLHQVCNIHSCIKLINVNKLNTKIYILYTSKTNQQNYKVHIENSVKYKRLNWGMYCL